MADWGFHRNKMEFFTTFASYFAKINNKNKITPHNLWNARFPWIELAKSIKPGLLHKYSDLT